MIHILFLILLPVWAIFCQRLWRDTNFSKPTTFKRMHQDVIQQYMNETYDRDLPY